MADETGATAATAENDSQTRSAATAGAAGDGQRDADGTGTLGEAGKAALAKERAAREAAIKAQRDAEQELAATRKKLADLEDAGKSEVERAIARMDRQAAELAAKESRVAELEARIAAQELADLKREIAAEVGLPPSVAHRLVGTDARSLKADANRYLEELESSRKPGQLGIGQGGAGTRRRVDMNAEIRRAAGRS